MLRSIAVVDVSCRSRIVTKLLPWRSALSVFGRQVTGKRELYLTRKFSLNQGDDCRNSAIAYLSTPVRLAHSHMLENDFPPRITIYGAWLDLVTAPACRLDPV